MDIVNNLNESVALLASKKTWMDHTAITQLLGTAGLSGMRYTVGFPDLHPGKCGPVGASFLTEDVLYPHLIGNDIGCGMAFWQTDLAVRKVKLDRWEKQIENLDDPFAGGRDACAWLEEAGLPHRLLSEGVRDHRRRQSFSEWQQVETILDDDAFGALGLDKKFVFLLVHSGSRGVGNAVLKAHREERGFSGLDKQKDAEQWDAYLSAHHQAVAWAKVNRSLIGHRSMRTTRCEGFQILDLSHNYLSEFKSRENEEARGASGSFWLHRKGAAPSNQGPVILPGSRGAYSYLAIPQGKAFAQKSPWGLLDSLAHGAGRKWARNECKGRLRGYQHVNDLKRSRKGGRVICEDRNLLYEEAPDAYKNIDQVVDDLVVAGAIKLVARFKPMLTYKVRRRYPMV